MPQELWHQELELHRHRREKLDNHQYLVEERFQYHTRVRPGATEGYLLDRLIPDIRMQMVLYRGIVVRGYDRNQEADRIERDHSWPRV